MHPVLFAALVFLVPGLLALIIGCVNDARRNRQKREGTYTSRPDNVFYVYTYGSSGCKHEKKPFIRPRNQRNEERTQRHHSAE